MHQKNDTFGLSAALITPFREDGDVDLDRLVAHAAWVTANGCDGFTLFGTTGEGYGLSLRERADIFAALRAAGQSLDTACAGVTDATPDGAAEQARMALDAGVRGLLFTPPFYLKAASDDGIFAWYSTVFDRIGSDLRGVILYNIPGQTAVALSVPLVSRLRDAYPEAIAGVKDSSGSWDSAQAFLAAHGDLAILIGDERLLARGLRHGAEGSICGVANFAPERLRALFERKEDDPKVAQIVDLVVSHPIMPAVKALVAHRVADPGYLPVRPPLVPLGEDVRAALVDAFERIVSDG